MFISLIRKHIKSSNFQAIRLLKIPMAIFYKDNPQNNELFAEIFAKDFNEIISYWDEYYLEI